MQSSEISTEGDNWKPRAVAKKRRYGIETRYKPTLDFRQPDKIAGIKVYRSVWKDAFSEWYITGWYACERDRDKALEALTNKTPMIFPNGRTLNRTTEYRKSEK